MTITVNGVNADRDRQDVPLKAREQPTEISSKEPVERRAYTLLKIVAWAYRNKLSLSDVTEVAEALEVNDQAARSFAAERLWERAQVIYDFEPIRRPDVG